MPGGMAKGVRRILASGGNVRADSDCPLFIKPRWRL